ncbi:ABC transporter substrate-binding protein [Gayadomonas joobiniege]|uniref:ABC transporter substrate-binding protein n=1 Tax=Gayadomonas joobiniege TaxID=1234606 RepID=UPI00037A2EED|nr:ABC transporter substrate-binding protein [Gayadomonas joobiniege]
MTFIKLVIAVCAAVFLFTACTQPQEKSSIRISGPFEAITLDPSISGFMFSRLEVIQTLVDVNPSGELVPSLATEWFSSKDGTVWTFKLRKNVQFHNGRLLTANDVTNALKVALNKPGPIQHAGIVQIKSENNDQIHIYLKDSYPALPSVLSNYSTAILARESYDKPGSVKELIATGPYQISEFAPPHQIKVTKFSDFWGQTARIKSVEYITGHRSESRAMMVRTGQAKIVYNLDPATLTSLKTYKNVQVHRTEIPRTIMVKLNLAHPHLADPNVRKALSLAIDRQAIASQILKAPGSAANQIFGPILKNWHLAKLEPEYSNVMAAQKYLKSAGWQLADDHLWYKNGEPLSLNLITYANRPELIVLATVLQAQWRELGILVQVLMENSSAIPSGHADGSLEMALIARNFGTIGDPFGLILNEFSHSDGGDWGPMNYTNAEVFTTLNKMRTLNDNQEFFNLAQQTASLIQQDIPLIPIAYYLQSSAVSNSIQQFEFDPFERSFLISRMSLQDNE